MREAEGADQSVPAKIQALVRARRAVAGPPTGGNIGRNWFLKTGRHAEIAGGGIAGLTAAIALAQRNWSVRVHERSEQLRAEGSGIYIWENGLRVLTAIGVYDAATAGCHQGPVRETRDDRNKLVAVVRWCDSGHRVMSLGRAQLMNALLEKARSLGVEVVFGSEAVAAHPEGFLEFADGTRARADLIVAADGINSKVRDSLDLVKSRHRHVDGAIRLVIRRTEKERVEPDSQNYVEYWSGNRRILYTPCNDNDLYLALTTLDTDTEGKQLPLDKAAWKKSFPHLEALIERIDGGGRWDLFETVKLKSWSRGRVAVVGDAAHAQAPNLGQGGGCSLMNALSLAVTLEADQPVVEALKLWERRERPLTEHTQLMTAMYSKMATWPPLFRSVALRWIAKSRWITALRMRTMLHNPTGT